MTSGSEDSASARWTQAIFIAVITVTFGVIISFIAEIRGEQQAMLSRFEERTVANQQTLKRLAEENDRQNVELSRFSATVTKYEAYMENLRLFSSDMLEFRAQMSNFNNRLSNLSVAAGRFESQRLNERTSSLEDRLKQLKEQVKDLAGAPGSALWDVYQRMNDGELRRRPAPPDDVR